MFLHSRFVIVDDKEEHLKGIKEALDQLRLDGHTKLYDVATVGDWEPLPGTRIIFMDKNLRPGVTMGGAAQDSFSAIAEVLTKLISPESGPYGLVLWAEEPQVESLRNFLYQRLKEGDAAFLPVFFAELRKGDYISTVNGEVHDAERLKADILAALQASPQMRALFAWEADVLAASDAVLRSIVNLVPLEKRASDDFATELGKVFYRLSQAGAGIERAKENPREAINSVLVPILSDRIVEHDPEGNSDDVWSDALVEIPGAEKNASINVQAEVNTAIHLSFARSQKSAPIRPTDLGAVIKFPFEDIENTLVQRFGISKTLLLDNNFFGMNEDDWDCCTLRLVQIGASCDHAQPKQGPLLYLLGLEWPFTNEDGTKANGASLHAKKSKKSGVEWQTPVVLVGADKKPGRISVFLNCSLSAPRSETAEWEAELRFRDELISHLTQEYARHISRPGIVEL